MPKKQTLTTTAGAPIADNQNSITAGPRGPVCRKTTSSSRNLLIRTGSVSRLRTTHAKSWGAHGMLTITGDISKYTKAKALHPGARRRCSRASQSSPASSARQILSGTCAALCSNSTGRQLGSRLATTRRCAGPGAPHEWLRLAYLADQHRRRAALGAAAISSVKLSSVETGAWRPPHAPAISCHQAYKPGSVPRPHGGQRR